METKDAQELLGYLSRSASALERIARVLENSFASPVKTDVPGTLSEKNPSAMVESKPEVNTNKSVNILLDRFDSERAVRAVKHLLLISPKSFMVHELGVRIELSRDAMGRFLHKMKDALPFILCDKISGGTSVRIDLRDVPAAEKWVADTERHLGEHGVFDGARAVSPEAYEKYAPEIMKILVRGPSNTKLVTNALGITRSLLGSILRQMEERGLVEASRVGRGQPTPLRMPSNVDGVV